MVFKKHDWVQYGRPIDVVKMAIFDPTGRMVDNFQFNENKGFNKVIKILKDSYGYKEEELEEEDELKYLKKHTEHNWLD